MVFEEFLGKYSQTKDAVGVGKSDKEELLQKFIADYPAIGGRLKALREYVPPIAENLEPRDASKTQDVPNKNPEAKKTVEPAMAPLKLDWQALGVGLGAGILVGFLLAWRLRDRLRRRHSGV
jgi:hypothetical protein